MEFPDKFKEMMEDESEDDELEKVSEAFICCICRDLLYKPVVLACGHISCFWCVHKSMDGLHNSRCPICRKRYYHFPYICQMLHLLLLKMYPAAYQRRENQILEEEKEMGYFSPQFSGLAQQSQPKETITHHPKASLPFSSEAVSLLNPCFTTAGEALENAKHVESISIHHDACISNMQVLSEDTAAATVSTVKDRHSSQINSNRTSDVSICDALCGTCKSVLFRPVVLNCGHAFCISCVVVRPNEILKCEVCQSPHPGDFPKVCLEFDHFLEQQFPKEYDSRRSTFHMKQEQLPTEAPNACPTDTGKGSSHFSFSSGDDPFSWWNSSLKVHFGVGCDSCGLYPIIGDRYRCKDCVEKIGYDLCKDCYTTRSKLPGRFNQQHTSDHQFEIVKSNAMHNIMLRLLRGQLREVTSVADALRDGSDETNEDAENASDTNQNEDQPSAGSG